MATQLDEKIEQLQNMVEKCFDLHKVKIERPLPENRRPAEPRESPTKFLTKRVP